MGLQKDLIKAMELFLEASKLRCAGAHYNLGNFYREEWGVETDMKKAVRCYELEAIGGSLSRCKTKSCLIVAIINEHTGIT